PARADEAARRLELVPAALALLAAEARARAADPGGPGRRVAELQSAQEGGPAWVLPRRLCSRRGQSRRPPPRPRRGGAPRGLRRREERQRREDADQAELGDVLRRQEADRQARLAAAERLEVRVAPAGGRRQP